MEIEVEAGAARCVIGEKILNIIRTLHSAVVTQAPLHALLVGDDAFLVLAAAVRSGVVELVGGVPRIARPEYADVEAFARAVGEALCELVGAELSEHL